MITYGVEKTACYPNAFYGGPFWNGRTMERAACYFFKTFVEAAKNAKRLKELQSQPDVKGAK